MEQSVEPYSNSFSCLLYVLVLVVAGCSTYLGTSRSGNAIFAVWTRCNINRGKD